MKIYLLLSTIFLFSGHVYSQDVILLNNTKALNSKVIKIKNDSIEYKTNEIIAKISISEVYMIRYENGEKLFFKRSTNRSNLDLTNSRETTKPTINYSENRIEKNIINIKNDTKIGIVSDFEGTKYKTTKIGTQWWMSEDLRSTKYNDGEIIMNAIDSSIWSKNIYGAFSYFDNSNDNNILYNWYSINSNKLCPIGYHVPNLTDWNILINFLGDEKLLGAKIKYNSTKYWPTRNTSSKNEYGFSAIPSGFRYSNGIFGNHDNLVAYWSASDTGGDAWYFGLFDNQTSILKSSVSKNSGLSVRCVMD